MLLRLVVKNFLSFRREMEFNTFPYERISRHKHHVYEVGDGLKMLKTSAIYGANGSGKTNLVKALSLLQNIATDRQQQLGTLNAPFFKLSEKGAEQPISIEAEFKSGDSFFAYGVDLLDHKIREEWLYRTYPRTGKQELIFERKQEGVGTVSISTGEELVNNPKDRLLIEIFQEDRDLLPHDQSLLFILQKRTQFSRVAQAYEWFSHKLFIHYPQSDRVGLLSQIVHNERFLEFANDLISKLDTGVQRLELETMGLDEFLGDNDANQKTKVIQQLESGESWVELAYQNGLAIARLDKAGKPVVQKLMARHASSLSDSQLFELGEESDGTLRMIDLLPMFELVQNGEYVCVVDEIGRSIHPAVLKEMMNYFVNRPTKGQLVFTTHEGHLLDLEVFRQDEIWFMEKGLEGGTSMYPLSDYKPRYDLNIRKGYLNGRFGAIPYLVEFSKLSKTDAKKE
ncbi:ATP-binding protein [Pontibacter sp. G13]|uniref:AAA family ATPase n=1 Tax=Pontibacter sp. G13 TaxID=3074898 RepID=UPI00288AEDF7|nr:ATP-binding protein [Pontibacter sp. G13]WNJ17340.1 ATP-binding protein [Pontibacter sp. G13]